MIKYLVIIILDHTNFSLTPSTVRFSSQKLFVCSGAEELFHRKLFSVGAAYLYCK